MITIIHGPQASGKTFHKEAFAAHYGCTHIVEEWNPREHELPDDHRLCLTLATPEAIQKAIRLDRPEAMVRVVSIHDARSAIGVTAVAPPLPTRRPKP
ncbi:MAG: hypothetical protein V4512_06865 [Pseudomonadota bacterium]